MESLHFLMIGMILLVDIIMSKKVIVDDEKNMSDTAVYKWYIVFSIVIAIPFFVAVWILDLAEPQPLLPFFMTLFFCFRACMEFKYIRETRRHLVSNAMAATALLFTALLLLLRLL